jgi:hypothetical protein
MEMLLQQNLEEAILIKLNRTDESLEKVVYLGARFLSSETTGEMAFLNNIVVLLC